jgi:hypothetical protein
MIIPKFWGRAEREVKKPGGGLVYLVKWDWSEHSIDDARDKAQQRLEAVVSRVASGQPFPVIGYGYGENIPLREEVVREVPLPEGETAVITRNLYGALVLNVEKVMFVDIDLPDEPKKPAQSGFSFGKLVGKLFGQSDGMPPLPSAPQPSSPEAVAMSRIEQWTMSRSGWGFRIYRTASGLRLLATHGLFQPDAPETIKAMEQLGCDPLYLKLCKAQKSFRARLTPKPWRVGLHSMNMKFPYRNVNASKAWVKDYDAASDIYITCRFMKAVGSGQIHPTVQAVINLHDEPTFASDTQAPLA